MNIDGCGAGYRLKSKGLMLPKIGFSTPQ